MSELITKYKDYQIQYSWKNYRFHGNIRVKFEPKCLSELNALDQEIVDEQVGFAYFI